MNKARILITGGSGFIGTNAVDRALVLGFDILSIDVRQPKNLNHSQIFKQVDLKNLDALKKVFQQFKPNLVLHLAARTDLGGSKLQDYEDNVHAVRNLCRVLIDTPSVESVVFASSMLVCSAGDMPKYSDHYSPSTVYGESKVEMENIIREFCDDFPFAWTTVRPTSIWGPWFEEPYKNFFYRVMNGSYFLIGERASVKTYGYVGNAVNQMFSCLVAGVNFGLGPKYLGDSLPMSADDWAIKISSVAGVKMPSSLPWWVLSSAAVVGDLLAIFSIKFPMTTFRLNNMTTDNVIEPEMLLELENIYSPVSLQEGIAETLAWLKFMKLGQ
ncbi:NAD-dependent epimerase/dehydratase family protein [Marinagarivorans cellulosilyticus]|uniref:GlcNAc-P-P-Und epimerase n=1 Tax=Marinagarivorans cellulosilyticus TaxID=2721545 RepID=A0AAN1WIQ6_9GAMM|nr:NAD-dependent epimerase/dehydratase family protein [Marinagarivorans cellulosilyticus]BCD98336.1 GlcNAc-P-P-Und epimerase [Marinagarivorans cellulosilyticus]